MADSRQPAWRTPETKELGSGAPASGLYLREDIEIKCNPAMVSFVKKEMKASSKTMVDRLVKKAELIDAGVLSAMFDDGKLKTMNPADRSQTFQTSGHYSPGLLSPALGSFGAPPPSPGFHPSSAHPNYAHNQSAFAQNQQNQSAYARQSQFGQYGNAPPLKVWLSKCRAAHISHLHSRSNSNIFIHPIIASHQPCPNCPPARLIIPISR